MKCRIEQDLDPTNPREEFDHLGVMVCFHRRYRLGDRDHGYDAADYDDWDEVFKDIRENEHPAVILPIYMYDHGGVTVSTQPFSCAWDSGQIGFIFARREDVRREYKKQRISKKIRERVKEVLRAEVKEYDQFLTGDVWGFAIESDQGDDICSCWGFFGREACEEEAKREMEYWETKEAEKPPEMAPAPVCAVP